MIRVRNLWTVLAFAATVTISGTALAAGLGGAQSDAQKMVASGGGNASLAIQVAAPANCTEIKSEVLPVAICLDPGGWALGNLEGNQEHSFRRKDHELYLMVITEKDYFPAKTLRDAILVNAQNAAGLNKVNVIAETTQDFTGTTFNRIVYRTKVDDLDVTYDNYYTGLEGKGSVQFVFFSLSSEYDGFKSFIEGTAEGISASK